jgi:hypothetical protein
MMPLVWLGVPGAPLPAPSSNRNGLPDWATELRLTLANYALMRALDVPEGFECTYQGKAPKSCHCWDFHGQPSKEQYEDQCHFPPQCLSNSKHLDGTFKFKLVPHNKTLMEQTLTNWGVPHEMFTSFHAAILTNTSTFVAFDFKVDHKTNGEYEINVGTSRMAPDGSGQIQLGWVWGRIKADLVQPVVRHVGPGHCHGTSRDMKPRGYNSHELAFLEAGLRALSFRKAATLAENATAVVSVV